MTQLKPILMAILAFLGALVALPNLAARRGGDKKRGVINFLPILAVVCTATILTACGGSAGNIAEYTSAYDGTKHRTINPLFVAAIGSKWNSAGFAVGLYSIDEDYFLEVKMHEIIGIESVGINVDGRKFESHSDELPDFEVDENPLTDFGAESTQWFPIPKEWIFRMTRGKRVIIQVRTSEGVVEGDFSAIGCDVSGSACEAFSNFLR